ncbi:hypothetical protein V8E54_006562 [Elaphomyces granulatus]
MLDANTSSGPDRERAGLKKETLEPPHGKLEKADPGPVSACTANIVDRLTVQVMERNREKAGRSRKRCSDRPGRNHEKADHSACMAETQTGKEANMMVGRQPFPSYATNGFFEITAPTESLSAGHGRHQSNHNPARSQGQRSGSIPTPIWVAVLESLLPRSHRYGRPHNEQGTYFFYANPKYLAYLPPALNFSYRPNHNQNHANPKHLASASSRLNHN